MHELFERVIAVNERIVRNAIREGAEVICLGDDYASNNAPLFSPDMFRRFVRPYLKRIVDAVHEEGVLVVKHTDGNIWPIIDDIVSTGIDGLHPLEPVAGMDLAEVKAAYRNRCTDRQHRRRLHFERTPSGRGRGRRLKPRWRPAAPEAGLCFHRSPPPRKREAREFQGNDKHGACAMEFTGGRVHPKTKV